MDEKTESIRIHAIRAEKNLVDIGILDGMVTECC